MPEDRNYTPTTWVDHFEDPATGEVFQQGTPVDAQHLNNIEGGIVDAHYKADEAQQAANAAQQSANGKAPVDHNHDAKYSHLAHNHDGRYSPAAHNHDGVYSPAAHTHNGVYEPANGNIVKTNQGATMTAELKANGAVAIGTAQVRNIYAGTGDMTAGVTGLTTGTIYFVYE